MESKKFIPADSQEWEVLGSGLERKVLGYNEDLMVVRVKFVKDGVAAMHAHPHTQSSYIASGKFEFTVNGETRLVAEGDGILIKPNQPHACLCLEPGIVIDTFSPMREDFVAAKQQQK